jgi:plasmid stability protein
MAELKVRQVEESVVAALKARARRRAVSLEEEVRATL